MRVSEFSEGLLFSERVGSAPECIGPKDPPTKEKIYAAYAGGPLGPMYAVYDANDNGPLARPVAVLR